MGLATSCLSGRQARDGEETILLKTVHRELARRGPQAVPKCRFLHDAARLGDMEVLQLLVQHVKGPAGCTNRAAQGTEQAGASPSQTPAASSSTVSDFLSKGNHLGETALHLAARLKHGNVCGYLLSEGADALAVDRLGGRTPLHNACLAGSPETIRALLEGLPACVDRQSYLGATTLSGLTPLHFAAASGNHEAVSVLLDAGCDMYCATKTIAEFFININPGTTPLHVAASKSHMGVVMEILHYYHVNQPERPDPRRVQDSCGLLPYHLAPASSPVRTLLAPTLDLAALLPPQEAANSNRLSHRPMGSNHGASASGLSAPPLDSLAELAFRVVKQGLEQQLMQLLREVECTFTVPSPARSRIRAGHSCRTQEALISRSSRSLRCSWPLTRVGVAAAQEPGIARFNQISMCSSLSDNGDTSRVPSGGAADAPVIEPADAVDASQDEPEVAICEVCLETPSCVQLQPCGHSLCKVCAHQLVSWQVAAKPVTCTTCNVAVSGFQRHQGPLVPGARPYRD